MCIHLSAEDCHGLAGGAQSLGNCIEVIDPVGEDENVSVVFCRSEDIGDGGAWICAPAVAESGGMHMEYRMVGQEICVVCGKLTGTKAFERDVVRPELVIDQILEPVTAFRSSG